MASAMTEEKQTPIPVAAMARLGMGGEGRAQEVHLPVRIHQRPYLGKNDPERGALQNAAKKEHEHPWPQDDSTGEDNNMNRQIINEKQQKN